MWGGQKEKRWIVSPVHNLSPLLTSHLNQLLLNEELVQMKAFFAKQVVALQFLLFCFFFSFSLWEYLHCTTHGAPHMAAALKTRLIAEGALCRLQPPLNHLNGAVNKM